MVRALINKIMRNRSPKTADPRYSDIDAEVSDFSEKRKALVDGFKNRLHQIRASREDDMTEIDTSITELSKRRQEKQDDVSKVDNALKQIES